MNIDPYEWLSCQTNFTGTSYSYWTENCKTNFPPTGTENAAKS
jgi:hypothetical protein